MRKAKMMQYLLICAVAVATALFIAAPFTRIAALIALAYVFFVLLPTVTAIVLRWYAVKEKYAAYKAACKAYQSLQNHKEIPQKRFLLALRDDFHLVAARKGRGINPNRAGPVAVIA